jgi:hypothetical protein
LGALWRARPTRHPADLLATLIVGATFLWCLARASRFVWYATFTGFAPYDDEGYVLLSAREFLAGRALYDEVFSQYGPAYYAFKHVLSLAHGVPTHDITRWTTTVLWLSSSSSLAVAALWLTRSGIAATVTFGAMVLALQALRSEPGHPQELLVFLTALSIATSASPLRGRSKVILLTALAAFAAFTKMNVGIFVGLAVVGTVVPWDSGIRRLLIGLLLAAMPPTLMARHLSWAWPYAVATSAGILAGVTMACDVQVRIASRRTILLVVTAALVPVVTLCVYLMFLGSTLPGIAAGVLRPFGLADVYINAFKVPPVSAIVSLGVAAFAVFGVRHYSTAFGRLMPLLPVLKIVTGLYVVYWLVYDKQAIVGFSAVLIVVFLAGLHTAPRAERFGRVFLALSAMFHACTAYPVAGSQMWWSTYLLILIGVVCAWDGMMLLVHTIRTTSTSTRTVATTLACVVVAAYFPRTTPVWYVKEVYEANPALPFDGSTSIHVNAGQAATYSWLVANLQGRCSDFVALPGYPSLHIWSGIRPVTGFNLGAWMFILTRDEQVQTVARMQRTPRPCAIFAKYRIGDWTQQPVAGLPLADYILGLTPAASEQGFEIRVPPNHLDSWSFNYLLAGRRSFGPGVSPYLAPVAQLPSSGVSLRLWFRTRAAGVILGLHTGMRPHAPGRWCPVLFVGHDGRLRAELWNGTVEPIATPHRLDDGKWHHVVLVADTRQHLYVDGTFVGEIAGARPTTWARILQIGDGYTATWPEGSGGWLPFSGEIRDVIVDHRRWTEAAVLSDWARSADGEASR